MATGREILGYENRAKLISIRITGGGASPACKSKGVKSVAKTATGTIKVTLDKTFARLLYTVVTVQINGAVTTTIADAANIDARNVTVDGTLLIYTAASAGGANADLASTRDIMARLIVSDSSV